MKKVITILALMAVSAVFSYSAKAQGTLQFNQVLVVGATEDTVPAGKVWKAEAVYGEQLNVCIPIDCSNPGYYAFGIISGLYVNGTFIPSSIRGFKTSQPRYADNICTSQYSNTDQTCNNKATDPNILPMWLPAGYKIKSVGASSYVSLIEFNIIP